MTGIRCAVATCYNNNTKKIPKRSFHRFPKNPKTRKQWIICCKRQDKFNADTSFVCSDHFDSNDFELSFKSELLSCPSKKQLKPNVIPHCNLPRSLLANGSKQSTESGRKRKLRMEQRQIKQDTVESLINKDIENIIICDSKCSNSRETGKTISSSVSSETVDYKALYEEMVKQNGNLKRENEELRRTLERRINNILGKITS